MLETGSISRLPAKYRMLLALSVALLIHTLIAAGLSLLVTPQQPPHISSLNVTLIRSGHDARVSSTVSTPAPVSSTAKPAPQPAASRQSQPTTRESPQTIPEPTRPAAQPKPAPESPRQEQPQVAASEPPHPAQPQAAASEADHRQGARSPIDGADEDVITQVTPATPNREPSYTDMLVVRIAKEAGREALEIPNQAVRKTLQPLQLELKLMPNGTLVRADIIKSTGIRAYDQSVLRAALRASPFPEPPRSARASGLRFRITVYLKPAT